MRNNLMIVAILFFIFLLSSCAHIETPENAPYYRAKVSVMENDSTHRFTLYFAQDKTLLDGYITIDNKRYPGKILYTQTDSYLFRPNPNQAVVFPQQEVIYGFVPPAAALSHADVTIIKRAENGFPVKYSVNNRSIVTFSGISYSEPGINFSFPKDTHYFNQEEMIFGIR